MSIFEQESHLIFPITIKKPTTLDLKRLLEVQKKNPEISITFLTGDDRNTSCEVINHDKADQALEALTGFEPFTKLLGTIIVRRPQRR